MPFGTLLLFLPFDLIKAGATQTETSLPKKHTAGERVDLLDDYDFPARTILETSWSFFISLEKTPIPMMTAADDARNRCQKKKMCRTKNRAKNWCKKKGKWCQKSCEYI